MLNCVRLQVVRLPVFTWRMACVPGWLARYKTHCFFPRASHWQDNVLSGRVSQISCTWCSTGCTYIWCTWGSAWCAWSGALSYTKEAFLASGFSLAWQFWVWWSVFNQSPILKVSNFVVREMLLGCYRVKKGLWKFSPDCPLPSWGQLDTFPWQLEQGMKRSAKS